jgi:hypothetical protein
VPFCVRTASTLIVSTLFGLVAFAFFWIARKTIREDNVS